MAVGKLNRKNEKEDRSVDEFISMGGSSTRDNSISGNEGVRITLRCPKHIIDGLDRARKERPGRISRNQLIVEVLDVFVASK